VKDDDDSILLHRKENDPGQHHLFWETDLAKEGEFLATGETRPSRRKRSSGHFVRRPNVFSKSEISKTKEEEISQRTRVKEPEGPRTISTLGTKVLGRGASPVDPSAGKKSTKGSNRGGWGLRRKRSRPSMRKSPGLRRGGLRGALKTMRGDGAFPTPFLGSFGFGVTIP